MIPYIKIEEIILDIFFQKELKTLDEINSKIYDSLYNDNKDKSSGTYYTPPFLATKIVKRAINVLLKKSNYKNIDLLNIEILDPSCGSGEFLVACSDMLYEIIIKTNQNLNSTTELNYGLELRNRIIQNCIFGIDIEPIAIKTTVLRLICWKYLNQIKSNEVKINDNIENVKQIIKNEVKKLLTVRHIKKMDFFDIFLKENNTFSSKKFDLIIGNPPFNVKLGIDIRKIIKKYIIKPIHNSAAYFLIFSYQLLKENGVCSLILPKSIAYSRGWNGTKNFSLKDTIILQDLSKAFQQVKLEQIVLYIKKNNTEKNYHSEHGKLNNPTINIVDKLLCEKNKPLILGLDKVEYKLFLKIKSNLTTTMGDYIDAKRGINVQKLAQKTQKIQNSQKYQDNIEKNSKNIIHSIGGKEIKSFGLLSIPRCIEKEKIPVKFKNKQINSSNLLILGQLANAHVKNPQPHFKLAFTLIENLINNELVTFDTVINISIKDKDHYPLIQEETIFCYILGYLNSYIFAWYLYKIVYSSAIRSTRLDEIYLSQVPLNPIFSDYENNKEILIIIEAIVKGIILLEQIEQHYKNNHPVKSKQPMNYELQFESKKKLLTKYLNHLYFILHVNPKKFLCRFDGNNKEIKVLEKFITNWNENHQKNLLINLPKNIISNENKEMYLSQIIQSKTIENVLSTVINIFLIRDLSENIFNIQKTDEYKLIFNPFKKKNR